MQCYVMFASKSETNSVVKSSRRPVRLRNIISSATSVDSLHQSNVEVNERLHDRCVINEMVSAYVGCAIITHTQPHTQPIGCTNKMCVGSMMNWKQQSVKRTRSRDEVIQQARNFLDQYYASIKRYEHELHNLDVF